MKVSIIMPVYNRENYVKEAVESILNQSISDWELIVLDDCSTDRTVEVVESIHDSRIRVVKAPFKSNIPVLRNAGIQMAQGKFIGYMDSDDISVKDRFEQEVAFLEENPEYGLVSGNFATFGSLESVVKQPTTHEEIVGSLPVRSSITNGAVLMRRSLFEQGFRLHPEYFVAEDYAFWVDLIGHTRMAGLDKTLLKVRYGEHQTSTSSWRNGRKQRLREAIIKEIHRAAFTNLHAQLDDALLDKYSYYFGDTYRLHPYTEKDLGLLAVTAEEVKEKIRKGSPEYFDSFVRALEKKRGAVERAIHEKSD